MCADFESGDCSIDSRMCEKIHGAVSLPNPPPPQLTSQYACARVLKGGWPPRIGTLNSGHSGQRPTDVQETQIQKTAFPARAPSSQSVPKPPLSPRATFRIFMEKEELLSRYSITADVNGGGQGST